MRKLEIAQSAISHEFGITVGRKARPVNFPAAQFGRARARYHAGTPSRRSLEKNFFASGIGMSKVTA